MIKCPRCSMSFSTKYAFTSHYDAMHATVYNDTGADLLTTMVEAELIEDVVDDMFDDNSTDSSTDNSDTSFDGGDFGGGGASGDW